MSLRRAKSKPSAYAKYRLKEMGADKYDKPSWADRIILAGLKKLRRKKRSPSQGYRKGGLSRTEADKIFKQFEGK